MKRSMKAIVSLVLLLAGPFIKERIKKAAGSDVLFHANALVFLILYSTGWSKSHSLPFTLLGLHLQYRNEEDSEPYGIKRLLQPSVSTAMYALRLVQFIIEQGNSNTYSSGRNNAVKCKPMPIAKAVGPKHVKKWHCPICCQPLSTNNAISHASGYVYCSKCLDLTGDVVECPVSSNKCEKRHTRILHL